MYVLAETECYESPAPWAGTVVPSRRGAGGLLWGPGTAVLLWAMPGVSTALLGRAVRVHGKYDDAVGRIPVLLSAFVFNQYR